jgi:hypothetical protein
MWMSYVAEMLLLLLMLLLLCVSLGSRRMESDLGVRRRIEANARPCR